MIQILFIFIFICSFVYYIVVKRLNYWRNRNVAGPKPLFPFGNVKEAALRRTTYGEVFKEIYEAFPEEKVVGVYRMLTPCLLVRDLDIIKHIFIKDFENFSDRGFEISEEGLGSNLFHSKGDTWKILRDKFTALFTSGKLKNMFPLMRNKTDQLMNYVDQFATHSSEFEIHGLVTKYTLTNLVACVFGLDIGIEDKLADLEQINDILFTLHHGTELDMAFPGILKVLNMSVFPKVIVDFIHSLVDKVNKERKGVPSSRRDFMDLILEMREEKELTSTRRHSVYDESIKIKMTDSMIAAQVFIFYAAGFETSATTMACLLYELAMHSDVQDKLITEIDEVLEKNNNEITYDCLNEMTYLGKVFDETLRMYPVLEPLSRRALNDYELPGTNVVVKKNQMVLISGWGIHYDEKYYYNPHKFDPERFDAQNSKDRHSCAYLGFGVGPRNCIGLRFGKIQSKVGIVQLLSKYRVERSRRTQLKIEFDPYKVLQTPKGGIHLNIVPRF